MKNLNLGCGEDYKKGWINLDSRRNIKSDIRWDLNSLPYPFKKMEFDNVLLSHVLEHVNDPVKVLKEVIRISKENAKVTVIVPHANSYASNSDLQHKGRFTENTFTKEHLKEYELENLVLVRKSFLFTNSLRKMIPFKRFFKIFLNGIYEDISFEFKVER